MNLSCRPILPQTGAAGKVSTAHHHDLTRERWREHGAARSTNTKPADEGGLGAARED
jgi:hypothetical protein